MERKLDENFIRWLASKKGEDDKMLAFRLQAYKKFCELDNPSFGPEIKIDFNKINYYKDEINT